jgi:hypothetical protein
MVDIIAGNVTMELIFQHVKMELSKLYLMLNNGKDGHEFEI